MVLILLVGGFLRLDDLGKTPPGLTRDEASTGYDAYSMLLTGKDQYGEILPLFARSRGEYNESLYRFLAIPSIAVFGLSPFSVRLPAALIGILTLFFLYLCCRQTFSEKTALLQTLILTLSPWHIHMSRVAFRAILLPLFVCIGLYFFFKSRGNKRFLIYSSLTFSVALHTYSSARVYVPLLVLALILIYRKTVLRLDRHVIWGGLLFLSAILFLSTFWISSEGMIHARNLLNPDPFNFLTSYLSYFDPGFLFFNGDPSAVFSPIGFGQLHPIEILFVPIGIFLMVVLVFKKRTPENLVWMTALVLYPIPAALTGPSHSLRAIIGCQLFAVFSGYGVSRMSDFIRNTTLRRVMIAGTVVLLCCFCANFIVDYHSIYKSHSWYLWEHGWEEIIATVKEREYDKIYVSNNFICPNVFIMFFFPISPSEYQRDPWPVVYPGMKVERFSLSRFHILPVDSLDSVDLQGNTALLLKPDDLSRIGHRSRLRVVKRITSPVGYTPMILLEVVPSQRHIVETRD